MDDGARPIGRAPFIVRASLGAMSTKQDVDTFLDFLRTTFLEDGQDWTSSTQTTARTPRAEAFAFDLPVNYTTSNFPDVREVPRPRPMLHHFSSAPEATPRVNPLAMHDLIHGLATVK
ncbi:hypothetical protein Daesc_000373 [Daldinia eschscholtzii]|uniref:Molybdenum cofactor sulfurase n=1 Tax=Daldinia eschscholtzii TaxID=292717 RepID=A0AAX6MYI5_9PEZI